MPVCVASQVRFKNEFRPKKTLEWRDSELQLTGTGGSEPKQNQRCWLYFLFQRSFTDSLGKRVYSGQIRATELCHKLNFYLVFFVL